MDAVTQTAVVGPGGVVLGAVISQVGQVSIARGQRKRERLQLVVEAAKRQAESRAEEAKALSGISGRLVSLMPFAAELYFADKVVTHLEKGDLTEKRLKDIRAERVALAEVLCPSGAQLESS